MPDKQRLQGKVCLVTGAFRGIGRAVAQSLAEAGATIACHGRTPDRQNGQSVAQFLETLCGDGHRAFAADFAQPQTCIALIDDVLESMGSIDVLVNNAGIYEAQAVTEEPDEWLSIIRSVTNVNLLAPAILTQCAAKSMRQSGAGRIINVGSRGAFRGEPNSPAYAASKAGLHALSQSMAVALAADNIQVYAVAPGFVSTDMASESLAGEGGDAIRAQSPLNRVAKPEEVAELVLFLASSDTPFLTGGVVDINGASYLRT